MNLLRFRPTVRTERLYLPDGSSRLVKVTTNDAHTTQHVEDGDVLHGTARPPAVRVRIERSPRQRRSLLLRNLGMPRCRQVYQKDHEGLWAPVPGGVQ